MAAGPASRLGSIEPGDKTGLRLSPHLAPSTTNGKANEMRLVERKTGRSLRPPLWALGDAMLVQQDGLRTEVRGLVCTIE